MKTSSIQTIALFVLLAPVAQSQMSGVSRPEEVPVTTNTDGITQPVVYIGTDGLPVSAAAASSGLKQRPPVLRAAVSPSAPQDGARHVTPTGEIVTESSAYVPYRPDTGAAPAVPENRSLVSAASEPENNEGGVVIRVAGPSNQLPLGTLLKVKMHEDLSTERTTRGSDFSAELTEAVERDGRILLPTGSIVTGKVTDVHGGRRISGAAAIHLVPQEVTLPDGIHYAVQAQVIDTGLYRSTKVDTEGTIVRRDHPKETAAVFALTTGSGAAAGGVLGGVPGALIGGAVGAGIGTTMWLKKDRQTELPVNTTVVFALTGPLVIGR